MKAFFAVGSTFPILNKRKCFKSTIIMLITLPRNFWCRMLLKILINFLCSNVLLSFTILHDIYSWHIARYILLKWISVKKKINNPTLWCHKSHLNSSSTQAINHFSKAIPGLHNIKKDHNVHSLESYLTGINL